MKKTKKTTHYKTTPYPGIIATIPAGTPVVEATNQPASSWVKYWAVVDGLPLDERAESFARNYGFGFAESEVE